MKVSVIVTTYNRPDALVRVLDGLLAQTRLPDEIIVTYDGFRLSRNSKYFLNGCKLPGFCSDTVKRGR